MKDVEHTLWEDIEDVTKHIEEIQSRLKLDKWESEEVSNYAKALYYFVKTRRVLREQLKEKIK
jgi:hypothetical protein